MKSSFTGMVVLLIFICPVVAAQKYFQQEVNYTISVSLNDITHSLKGFESIQYINRSPDELKHLYFHLWPNAYKDNTTAFARQELANGSTTFHYSTKDEKGYIDSLDFRVNGTKVNVIPDDYFKDICEIVLPHALMPGDTMMITTPFYVKIPGPFSRLGHNGQAYQITQWYPKPAVYDRHGWNQMPYLDQGEFFSEYGSYDVSITLPQNYVVGATGNLLNPEELEWLSKKTTDSSLVVNFPASSPEKKTIRFREKNIHDFAWFADKRYGVRKGEIVLPNGHKVTTWAMFIRKQEFLWSEAITYINDAIKYYSEWYGDYPYDNCSAVYGENPSGGAMEYPTITVVGDAGTKIQLEETIVHEVGHNWFFGILGFNERRFPYLDEGLNTFSEHRYMLEKYPGLKMGEMLTDSKLISRVGGLDKLPFSFLYEFTFLESARKNLEQPLNLSSDSYTEDNYGMMAYYKASLVFNYLKHYLGEKKFDQIMLEFCRQWQFRHPGPEDLQRIFEEKGDESLGWLFDGLIGTTGKVDYAIKRIRPDQVLVKNNGQIAAPVLITAVKNNHIEQSKWVPGFNGKQWLDFPWQSDDKIVLFESISVPELNRKNDTYRTNGLLRWVEPLSFSPVKIFENPTKTSVGIMPAAGWNYYNQALLGVLLYSPLLPLQTLEYQIMPMVGLGNRDIAGMGRISLNLLPRSNLFRMVQITVDARRFGYGTSPEQSYNRARAEMLLTFQNALPRSNLKKTLKVSGTTASVIAYETQKGFLDNIYLNMEAAVTGSHAIRSFSAWFNLEKHNNHLKSSLEINLKQALKYSPNAIQLRLFAGGFISRESDFNNIYALRLSGAGGIHDYKFEHLYFGRFEDIMDEDHEQLLSQQFVLTEGGFVSNNPFSYSDRWLATAGVTLKVPKVPVSFFVNAGSYSGAGEMILYQSETQVIKSVSLPYEAGVVLGVGTFIRIYFPIVTSSDLSEISDMLTDSYWQTIRYCIDLNVINPFKIRNSSN